MDMTITEKILAKSAGKSQVTPGEIINANIDIALTHDVLCGPTAEEFWQLGIEKVWDPEKIVVTPDHFVPAKDIASAKLYQTMEKFVKQQGIRNYYPLGRHGICHVMLSQERFAKPGIVIVGTDSHTCTSGAMGAFAAGIGTTDMAGVFATGKCWFRVPESIKFVLSGNLRESVYAKDVILHILSEIGVDGALYKAMEFTGPIINGLIMDERFVLCNMAIEAGAKNGIINPDKRTQSYLRGHVVEQQQQLTSDVKADYNEEFSIDVSELEPSVAVPCLPSNVKTVREVQSIAIDQAVIGSCTGGRLSDLRIAAQVLKNKCVHSYTRLIVIPATQKIYSQALQEGLLQIFMEAGAVISTPTCGPCLGGHMGILGENEVAITTTNRNFKGRMGHESSKIYLASAATVAASAVKGEIIDPRDLV